MGTHRSARDLTIDVTTHTLVGMTPRLQDEIQQSRPFACLEQEAFLSLGRTWAVLEHAFSEGLKAHGITPTQYNVLRILRGAGETGLCRAEVTERMIAKVPDATRLLDRLEAAGFIARERSTEDRRYVTTRITGEGLRLLSVLDEPVEKLHRDHFGELDEKELKQLIDLLGRVRHTV
jgi:DNA-binding MarR family transcriptional regulator